MSAALRIPADLLPDDGRFGSGPSKVRTEAMAALVEAAPSYLGTSHRRDGVRSVVKRIRQGIATLFDLPDGYEVAIGNGGATAFWDAAVYQLIELRSQHLVFGEFSGKFARVAEEAPHLDDPVIAHSDPGTHPPFEPAPDVDSFALTQNETSTGVMMPLLRPAEPGLVLVDATSAAGAMALEPTDVDAYYFSPQKAFGADGGLWTALLSPAAIARIDYLSRSRWTPPSLDLSIAVENARKDQTYNTPALTSLFLLADQVEMMLASGGLPWAIERCRMSSSIVYSWADTSPSATPFVTDPAARSTTVVTVDLEGVDAGAVAATLRANGVVDTESYRKLGRNQLRIATFPNVEPADLQRLTAAIDWIIDRLGS